MSQVIGSKKTLIAKFEREPPGVRRVFATDGVPPKAFFRRVPAFPDRSKPFSFRGSIPGHPPEDRASTPTDTSGTAFLIAGLWANRTWAGN